MRLAARILIIMIALAEAIAWGYLVVAVIKWANGMAGGDGAGERPSAGREAAGQLILAVICLLIASPYICMIGGSLNLIAGKALRVGYAYSLTVLSIMTLILLMTRSEILSFMALGNVVAGGLWAFCFRE